jgi:glutamyl-tRNA synthetase
MEIYNIEREQKKPRKDYTYYSEIKDKTWYMYDEYFKDTEVSFEDFSLEDVKLVLKTYLDGFYNPLDNQEEWFNKIKKMAESLGYASDMKAYRENPENFKGSIVHVTNIIRIALTSLANTPNLYDIIRILGFDRVSNRINKVINK